MGTPRTPELSLKKQASAWLESHPDTNRTACKIIKFIEPFRIKGSEHGWYDNINNPVYKYGGDKANGRVSIRCLKNGCRVNLMLPEGELPPTLQGKGRVSENEYRTEILFSNNQENSNKFRLLEELIKTNKFQTLKYHKNTHSDDCTLIDDIENIKNDKAITETQRKLLIDARVGQGKFREDLITFWKKSCAVTQCDFKELLVASHIKPWKVANNTERLDKYNGLLLTANIDALFDKGYISFKNDGSIIFSPSLPKNISAKICLKPTLKINTKSSHHNYLKYHRENIFKAG